MKTWGELDLNYRFVAEIDQHKCIHCGPRYIACEDGASIDSVGTRAVQESSQMNGCQAEVMRSGGIDVLPGSGGDIINRFTIKQDIASAAISAA